LRRKVFLLYARFGSAAVPVRHGDCFSSGWNLEFGVYVGLQGEQEKP